MKKFFFVAMAVLFLAGCGTAAKESAYYEHNTHYRNWEHLKFSICGYQNIDKKDVQESQKECWWGIPVEGTTKK
jgi:hypothetical protein